MRGNVEYTHTHLYTHMTRHFQLSRVAMSNGITYCFILLARATHHGQDEEEMWNPTTNWTAFLLYTMLSWNHQHSQLSTIAFIHKSYHSNTENSPYQTSLSTIRLVVGTNKFEILYRRIIFVKSSFIDRVFDNFFLCKVLFKKYLENILSNGIHEGIPIIFYFYSNIFNVLLLWSY